MLVGSEPVPDHNNIRPLVPNLLCAPLIFRVLPFHLSVALLHLQM